MEAELAGLAGAKKLAGAAKLEVGFGDFKTVGSADHRFEACAASSVMRPGRDQDAMGLLRAAADAPAKLVQFGRGRSVPRAQ